MKKIFSVISNNGKTVKRLYVNQFVMSIFSIMVLFAASESEVMLILASVLAIGLYMFLTYNLMWETGAKAAAKTIDTQPKEENLKTALTLVLTGSLLNFTGAVAYLVMKIYVVISGITTNASDDMGVFVGNTIWTILRMINAMYWGIEALLFPNPNVGLPIEEAVIEFAPLLTPPYYFFITLLPVIIVGIWAYMLGASEISLLGKLGIDTKYRINNDINYKGGKK